VHQSCVRTELSAVNCHSLRFKCRPTTEAGNYLNSRQPPGEPKALANGKAPIFHFTLNQDTSFAVLGARQPNDPRGLGDYKVSQAIKKQVEKIKKVWTSQQSELPDRLTPGFDIVLG
jgi:hypothetical protein